MEKNNYAFGKILGEMYRIQNKLNMPCPASDAHIYGLLNGFEEAIEYEFKENIITSSEVNDVCDVLDEIWKDKAKMDGRYAASHPSRFRVIRNRENLGVGLSRNEGIRAASGEYIGFADNDDSTDPDMFRSLYEKAKEGDYDIVRCDVMVHRGEKLETRAYPTNCEDGSAALREEMLRYLLYSKPSDRADSLWPSGVWNKIYKRTLIDREELFFL